MGVALVFVLAGLVWPFLHLVGGNAEPESFFIPLTICGPAFFWGGAHFGVQSPAFKVDRRSSHGTVLAKADMGWHRNPAFAGTGQLRF